MDYKALHTMDGKECLTEFVIQSLGHSEVDPNAFSFGRGGWFYQLQSQVQSATPPEQEDSASQRREVRIPVRIPLMYAYDDDAFRGEAYNISFNGLFVLTESRLPHKNDSLDITFPIVQGDQMQKVRLTGRVCWVGAGMSSNDGGGLGLLITSWATDADTSIWRAFVQREIDFDAGKH